jgi:hypothetical protein
VREEAAKKKGPSRAERGNICRVVDSKVYARKRDEKYHKTGHAQGHDSGRRVTPVPHYDDGDSQVNGRCDQRVSARISSRVDSENNVVGPVDFTPIE